MNGHGHQNLSGRMVGRFSVRARLGAGGMGEVYLAEDTKLKRRVALKRVSPKLRDDPRYRERLLKEAERASQLNHPHIAGVFDVLERDDECFVVMEYVEGQTVRKWLRAPLGVEQFFDFGRQCAEALSTAHQHGIVHMDIKPENIMITPQGQVKILDFGVAKQFRQGGPDEVTASIDSRDGSSYRGTPGYSSPEMLRQKGVDGRADVFSLGVVFYEALTRQHPFRASSPMEAAARVLNETPTPVTQVNPRLPAGIDRIVGKMLAKDPAERYTAAGLLTDLGATAQRPGRERGLDVRLRPWWRHNRLRLGLTASALIAAGVLAVSFRLTEPVYRRLGMRTLPAEKHLAVLPLEPVRDDPEARAFSHGLTETLTAKLTHLTRMPHLQVVPASEIRNRGPLSAEEAGREFGVNLAITGSLQRAGEEVRILISLVDVPSRRQLHAETIDATFGDTFALEDRVVHAVISLLELEIGPPEEEALKIAGPAVPKAYEFYLQGRGYLTNYDKPENIDSAIAVLRRALTLDDGFALAHAGLGTAYWQKFDHTKEPQWLELATEACRESIRLDGELAAGHVCLGTVFNATGRYDEAISEFDDAIRAEPTNDDAFRGLGSAQMHLGNREAAEETYRRAIALRPHYWAGYSWLGGFLARAGRFAEAAEMFEQVVTLSPDSYRGFANLAGCYLLQARYSDAIPVLERSIALNPSWIGYSNLATTHFKLRQYDEAVMAYQEAVRLSDENYVLWGNLAEAYYWSPGKRDKAEPAYERAIELGLEQLQVNPNDSEILGELAKYHAMLGRRPEALSYLERARQSTPEDVELQFNAALVYIHLGEVDRALDWLEKALEGGYSIDYVRDSPDFDDLRGMPRFEELLLGNGHPEGERES